MKPVETTGLDDRLSLRTQVRRMLALRWPDLRQLFGMAFFNLFEHNVFRLAASVAFYTLLSLTPILIIVVAIAGAVFGRQAAEGQLVWQIEDLFGREGAETVQTLLRATQTPGAGWLASILGAIALFFGATAAFNEMRDALNTIWCVPRRSEVGLRTVLGLLRDRFVAFTAVLGVGFLLLFSLAVNATLAALSDRLGEDLGGARYLLQSADLLVAYIVFTVLFALIYKLLPDLHLEWRDVIPGAMVTALLFSVGRVLIGLYMGTAGIGSAFGAAGSLVVLLFWVYYSAIIFYVGAEFTQAYAQTFGSHPCDQIDKEVKIASTISEAEVEQPSHAVEEEPPRVKLATSITEAEISQPSPDEPPRRIELA